MSKSKLSVSAKAGTAASAVVAWVAVSSFFWQVEPVAGARVAEVVVYKDAQCGCCGRWVEHLRGHGFKVTTQDVTRVDRIKAEHGVPAPLASCHTALVGGYVVEGHVPADTIRRLLRERPAVKGIAVPGMPAGSPGMEGGIPQPYQVISFDGRGPKAVYESR